jgi:membrane-bound metal-dependent hydrolase YbcI (DUF457 family)
MLFFGHVGITVDVVRSYGERTGRRVDLRTAAIVAVLPDLIDKPVALLYSKSLGNHTRLFSHSLVASLFFFACVLAYGKWRAREAALHNALILWAVYLGHLFLDRLWLRDMHALLWPFLGAPPAEMVPIFRRWYEALTETFTVLGEVVGFVFLMGGWKCVRIRGGFSRLFQY